MCQVSTEFIVDGAHNEGDVVEPARLEQLARSIEQEDAVHSGAELRVDRVKHGKLAHKTMHVAHGVLAILSVAHLFINNIISRFGLGPIAQSW